MSDRPAGEASAPGICRLALPGGSAPAGAADAPSLLTRWETAWVMKELARWEREPPGDQDFFLWGPAKDWSFGRLFDLWPGHVRWCLENLNPATGTRQQKRFLQYVERRVAAMEEQGGAGSAAGRAQEGGVWAPGEASAPGGRSSEDGRLPLMLEDAAGEADVSCTPASEREDAENYLRSHRRSLQR